MVDLNRLNTKYTNRSECLCGSGEEPVAVEDSRGIYITIVCETCVEEKLSGYRNDVLYGPSYEAEEQIEETE